MADHGHHDPGGHELEAINTKLLFRLLISLSLVTLLASIAVVQWFYSQQRELRYRNAVEGSFQLQAYEAAMEEELEGVERVAQDVATNTSLLAAPPPPPGWIHPDDLVGGGAAAPAEAPEAPEQGEADEQDEPIPVEAPEDAEGEGEGAAEEPEPEPEPEPVKNDEADDEADDEPKPAEPKPAKADEADDEPKPPKPKPEDDAADGE